MECKNLSASNEGRNVSAIENIDFELVVGKMVWIENLVMTFSFV